MTGVNSQLSYSGVGATRPADEEWALGRHRFEKTVYVGLGDDCWARSHDLVLNWGVKVRSGFTVRAADGGAVTVGEGRDYVLTACPPLRIREPVRVVTVVDGPSRCGFAYGTLAGHPVSGEEAFIVSRASDKRVYLTLRSVTKPAPGWRRLVFPSLLLAQRYYRRRYLRALTC